MNRKLNEITISGSLVVYKSALGNLENTLQALKMTGEKVRGKFSACFKLTLVDNLDNPAWFECLNACLNNRITHRLSEVTVCIYEKSLLKI